MEEGLISRFIETEILPFITLKEGDREFEKIAEGMIKEKTETLNRRIRTEAGHITAYEKGLTDARNAETAESYRQKITEKEETIEALREERNGLKGLSILSLVDFFKNAEGFSLLDKYEKASFLPFFLKSITFDEIHEEQYRYVHPHNRKSKPYQKIVTSLELEPYFKELFILNRYHGGID